MMLHIPQVLTAEQVNQLTRQLAQAKWVDGKVSAGEQGARVKQNEQVDTSTPLYQQLQAFVVEQLQQHPLFFAATLPLKIASPQFNRYYDQGTYGFHVDGAVRQQGRDWLRTDISATLFLTAPESYQGGELVIDDTYGQHRVKLPAGDLVVYPSSSLHCVTPVSSGMRVASFLWIQSMVRDDKRRSLLFELDKSIQLLQTQVSDADTLLPLLNLYHNLLREWSEV